MLSSFLETVFIAIFLRFVLPLYNFSTVVSLNYLSKEPNLRGVALNYRKAMV